MEFTFLDALNTSLVAMIIVFSLLVILQYIIKFQSFVLNFRSKKIQTHKLDIIEEEEEQEVQEEPQDDLEVVAVIAAALSAYLDIPESNLKIKSIKRVDNNWAHGMSAIGNNFKG